jgi:hypothetical protein
MNIKVTIYLVDTTPTYVSILIGSSSGGLSIKLHLFTHPQVHVLSFAVKLLLALLVA